MGCQVFDSFVPLSRSSDRSKRHQKYTRRICTECTQNDIRNSHVELVLKVHKLSRDKSFSDASCTISTKGTGLFLMCVTVTSDIRNSDVEYVLSVHKTSRDTVNLFLMALCTISTMSYRCISDVVRPTQLRTSSIYPAASK